MPALRPTGLKRLPKRDGFFSWYWSATQVSRHSAGFVPRTVRLWHGLGEPTERERAAIEEKAHQLSMDLEEWVLSPGRKVRSARGTIYFVRAGENVKIGFSRDVAKRLAQLQTFFPFKLEVVLMIAGSAVSERALHAQFKSARVTGEWFRYAGAVAAFVEQKEHRQNRSSESLPNRQNRTLGDSNG